MGNARISWRCDGSDGATRTGTRLSVDGGSVEVSEQFGRASTITAVRDEEFNAWLAKQLVVKRVAVVSAVADQSVGCLPQEDRIDVLSNQGHLVR